MRRYARRDLYVALSVALAFGACGCKQSPSPGTANNSNGQGVQQYPVQDPASANLAPVANATDNTGAPAGQYQTPQARQQNSDNSNQPDPYAAPYPSNSNYDQNTANYDTPEEYAPQPPPELPEYQQPPCPGDNYIWTPGYWSFDPGQGYYWVPGAWVPAPYMGAVWTPGWWGSNSGRYGWHGGYWGRHVGYYGGIDYGYGYDGYGYQGGYWHGNRFAYNRVDNNVDPSRVHDVYSYRNQTQNNTRISYNGGRGVQMRPRPAEIAALREQHNGPLAPQMQLAQQARNNRQNFANVNHGRPAQPVANQPLRAANNIQPPQARNSGAIPPGRPYPSQPQQGGPRVDQQDGANGSGRQQNRNGTQPQGSGRPVRQGGPIGIPVHAVGPEPAVPRARMNNQPARTNNQPQQAAPYRPGPAPARATPDHTAAPTRQAPQARPEAQRATPNRQPTQHAAPQHSQRQRPQPKQQPDQKHPQ